MTTPSDARVGAHEAPTPVTASIERRVEPSMQRYALSWVRQGIDLATHRDGFLGAGWVHRARGSDTWHMLYRFDSQHTLDAWESSDERRVWVEAGADFARESRITRRTGIEGWFDSTAGTAVPGERLEIHVTEPVPPRWKQAVVVWLAFFPMHVAVTLLLGLVPGFGDLHVLLRLLVASVLLTPVMVIVVLPAVTRLARPWLLRGLPAREVDGG